MLSHNTTYIKQRLNLTKVVLQKQKIRLAGGDTEYIIIVFYN